MSLDTKPELAQCQKCRAYVFRAQVNGCLTLVDPAAIQGPELTIKALGEGKALYTKGPTGILKPSGNPLVGEHLATHACAVAGTVRADKVEVAPEGPQRAPVTPGGLPGGFRPAHAPVSGSQGHTAIPSTPAYLAAFPGAAAPANPHRSRQVKPTRCDTCNKLITPDTKDVVTIEYDGRLVYGQHERC